ncbi:MAG TPA: hypothetical protein ENJ89_00730, partial [Caldithrix abyssi]|nr:hypothetical protein [Caldithrix abyssi]
MKVFPAIRIEGGLFSPDLLDQLLAEELPGQKPVDFGLEQSINFINEVAAIFADAKSLWEIFNHRLERIKENDPGTSLTRDSWVIPFLRFLDFELIYNRQAYTEGGMRFKISHRAGQDPYAPPVHIVSFRQKLGDLPPSGQPRLSPHSLVQEFLNRTEALWGIVTNGKTLRLLRDTTYIRRQSYVEFDLQAIFEQRLFEDFLVLYRLLHRTRFPRSGSHAHQCFLEQYYQFSVEQGARVRDRLRDGVEKAIQILGNGFLVHPQNTELREAFHRSPDDPEYLSPNDFYQKLLRLIYRFLFLLVSEDRGLISNNPLYLEHYSISRLRRLVEHRTAFTDHADIWYSLRVLWYLLSNNNPAGITDGKPPAHLLDLPVLDGALFSEPLFENYLISNKYLLQALWHIIYYMDDANTPRRVNYAALDVEELGSVYESLLDFHPSIDFSGPVPQFRLVYGSERKSTGSYYTPSELVNQLIQSALEPVVKEKLNQASTKEEKEKALLSVKIVDPAAGSGHFLLAAARYLGKVLARIRTEEDEPAPESIREAKRAVIAHCIYGVDKNPLAVELCKVALWLESHSGNKPLTFLDHRIKCGDSLVGVLDLNVLKEGIPDDAYKPLSRDDREIASKLRRKNRNERNTNQLTLQEQIHEAEDIRQFSRLAEEIDRIPEDKVSDIQLKQTTYNRLIQQTEWDRMACNLWTAAFFQPRNRDTSPEAFITTGTLTTFIENGQAHPQAQGYANAVAKKHRFFHWPLEFPDVFARGGFDVVLGNPPWEKIKLQEKEFFSTRDPEIANAQNRAERRRLIEKLPKTNPDLW